MYTVTMCIWSTKYARCVYSIQNEFDVVFNAIKSVCLWLLASVYMSTQAIDITVGISGVAIPYVDKIKYLGASLSAVAVRLMPTLRDAGGGSDGGRCLPLFSRKGVYC